MNVLKKIKKAILLKIVNNIFKGTHAFSIKRMFLNVCDGIKIGRNTKIVTPIHIPLLSLLEVGENCWIGRDFTLEGNGEVTIGNNCDLGPAVTCITGSHKIGDNNRRAGDGFNGSIHIGSASWIGARALILPDVTIEKAVIVGAGTIVTKYLKSDCVYAGNPAKEIKVL